MEPTYSPMDHIIESIGNQYDKLVLEGFSRFGYTKEWLLNPSNRVRIHRNVLSEAGIDEWLIDDIVLFSIKRETCVDPSIFGITVRLSLEYHIGNFPEKTVTANGFE